MLRDDLEGQQQEPITNFRGEALCDACVNLKLPKDWSDEDVVARIVDFALERFVFNGRTSGACSRCVDLFKWVNSRGGGICPSHISGLPSKEENDDLLRRSTFRIDDSGPLLYRTAKDLRTQDQHSALRYFGTPHTSAFGDSNHVRSVGEYPNYEAIRVWLNHCVTQHTKCQTITISSDLKTDLEKIFLVDVEARELVPYPRIDKHAPDYFALSYVWGKWKGVIHRSQGTLPYPLPRTIEDAILVTRKLKVRYLWADTICINQDDPTHKEEQLSLMGTIYHGALAVIVPLDSNDSDDGFPRVRADSRRSHQLSLHFRQGKYLRQKLPRLVEAISTARWNRRGWTFQEKILSRRRIYFTEHQVHFSCGKMVCCEAWHDETYFHNNPEEEDTITMFPPNQEDDYFTKHDRMGAFEGLVDQYLGRKLTGPEDILNAFSGILDMLKQHRFPDGFCQALPKEDFRMSLLWRQIDEGNEVICDGRVRRSLDQTTRRKSETQLPSWSWIGWKPASRLQFYRPPNMEVGTRTFNLDPPLCILDARGNWLHKSLANCRQRWEPPISGPRKWLRKSNGPQMAAHQALGHASLWVRGIVLQLPCHLAPRKSRTCWPPNSQTEHVPDIDFSVWKGIYKRGTNAKLHIDGQFELFEKYGDTPTFLPFLLLDAYLLRTTSGFLTRTRTRRLCLELLVLHESEGTAVRGGTASISILLDGRSTNWRQLGFWKLTKPVFKDFYLS
ncbi:putative Heterokaryon incompatibility protein-domain-containing protein [Seiridium unicorne]|uniref:Heterokaryon incompatibility protein-domain-containing protein n=1 Tax=Seiridium unicorne TaxID=138068 RepID=A0ABR2V949_9PEZI